MREMQQSGPVSGVIVTSVSDARGTCTRQVIYPGNGAAPQVAMTGNACASLGTPAAQPEFRGPEFRGPEIRGPEIRSPQHVMPRTIEVRNRVPVARPEPIEVAQAR